MIEASEIRVGHFILLDAKIYRVLTQEIKGTGKFGKTIHMKLKCEEDGNTLEKSVRAEDKIEDVDVRKVRMQYLYKEQDAFIFMNTENYDQLPVPANRVGKREVFLKENTEIDVLFAGDKVLNIDFPTAVELKVTTAPPGVKGQTDTTYKEVELENGLKILVPQFVKEGEVVRVNVDELSYIDRVTTKSLKRGKGTS